VEFNAATVILYWWLKISNQIREMWCYSSAAKWLMSRDGTAHAHLLEFTAHFQTDSKKRSWKIPVMNSTPSHTRFRTASMDHSYFWTRLLSLKKVNVKITLEQTMTAKRRGYV
jgi:hypothetical protein